MNKNMIKINYNMELLGMQRRCIQRPEAIIHQIRGKEEIILKISQELYKVILVVLPLEEHNQAM